MPYRSARPSPHYITLPSTITCFTPGRSERAILGLLQITLLLPRLHFGLLLLAVCSLCFFA